MLIREEFIYVIKTPAFRFLWWPSPPPFFYSTGLSFSLLLIHQQWCQKAEKSLQMQKDCLGLTCSLPCIYFHLEISNIKKIPHNSIPDLGLKGICCTSSLLVMHIFVRSPFNFAGLSKCLRNRNRGKYKQEPEILGAHSGSIPTVCFKYFL